ncbi:MAG: hypothetical protein IJO32_03780 [Bacilli bacterium]|nr:hypothetical protein [Bacilli bacterium]
MKKKLYNIIFPIWILFIVPPVILIVLPSNFIIDSLVLIISLKLFKISNINEIYKKTIFKVWIFGFLSDIIGALFLFLSMFIPGNFWYDKVLSPLMWNPFETVYSFLYCTIAIIISGLFIYLFNKKITFKNINIKDNLKKKIAFILALVTAPYLFYLPTSVVYNNYFEDIGIIGYINK